MNNRLTLMGQYEWPWLYQDKASLPLSVRQRKITQVQVEGILQASHESTAKAVAIRG